jgi:hypothetical protein
VHRQPALTLAAVLLELAEVDEAVKERLLRLQLAERPDKLAAGFRQRLMAWQRSTRYYTYRDAPAYGQLLQAWLDQVGRELVPKDPAAGLDLFEAFIEADGVWFEHATIPPPTSGRRCAQRAATGCRPQHFAKRPRMSGPNGSWGCTSQMTTALGKNCCGAQICCSRSRRFGH